MKCVVILNPAAGHGRGERRFRNSLAKAGLKGPPPEVVMTDAPGAGTALARAALERGFTRIVAVGGDGTLGEVVDGFLSAPESLRGDATLGTFPAGSGCDFARHMRVDDSPETLARLLESPRVARIDAGLVEFEQEGARRRRHFLNVVSLGIGGEVARRMQRSGKPLGGTISYLLASLGALASARAYEMELIVDGQPRGSRRIHLAAIANTSTTGGGMKIAPGADAQDGKLELITVGDLSRLQLLRRFPSIYSGGHVGTEGVSLERVTSVELRSPEPVFLNIDGEAVGRLPARFELLPAAVPFLVAS